METENSSATFHTMKRIDCSNLNQRKKFSSILNDITNEIRSETDMKTAIMSQRNEIKVTF